MRKRIILFIITGIFISACSAIPRLTGKPAEGSEINYKMISPGELNEIQDSETFTFINVHIPWEGNIPGTDLELPYNDMASYADVLPQDKDEKVVIYCRSDSMGHEAAASLVDMGYTDVSNLEGGYIAWQGEGYPFEEQP